MTSADLAGELAIEVRLRDERVVQVRIESTRAQVADKLLAGRPVDEALALVPRVFSICGRSQSIAAQTAVEAARGTTPDAVTLAQRTRAIEAEMAHEYLWRALIDWPKAVGGLARRDALARMRDALAQPDVPVAEAIGEIVERDVLAGDSGAWYDGEHVAAFEIWVARAASPAARMLAEVQRAGMRHGAPRDAHDVPLLPTFEGVNASRVVEALEVNADFERAPTLAGRACETGAIARMASHPLVAALDRAYGRSVLTRFVARITELARLAAGRAAAKPLLGGSKLGAGRGLGWVETARGLLLHAIDVDGERIRRYRIVAPTEWNFHPHGALASGLVGTRVAGERELRQRAERLVQSLDPCVAYRLKIDHA